ncbi:MAG: tetratricopeptide repeat protein [Prevotella sp.]|nr:tetratricopeptide repeat protein [Prevotella sp.]MBR6191370.1 tetratricopeptide repeat protein [Prevotella sp.]
MAKQQANEVSQFEQTLNSQEAFFLKYRKQILIAVAAVIVIIAGIICYKSFIAGPRENKASTAIAKAQEAFAQQDFQKALNGDKTFEGFLAIAENYGGTDAANLAKGYAGLCYAQQGKWQEAVKYLDQFSPQSDAIISPAMVAALGNAYANTGKVDEAISKLKKAADMADSRAEGGVNNSLSPTYLIQAARLLESQKKNDEALKLYQQVKDKYVNSAASQDIDKYIERLSK